MRKKDGDNRVHQILPHILRIILYIPITPEKLLSVPIVQALRCELGLSHMGPKKPLSSHRESLVSQGSRGGHTIAMARNWPWHFRGNATLPLLAHLVSTWWFFQWTCVALQGQHGSSITASHEYTVYNLILNENMWLNNPTPHGAWIMKKKYQQRKV